MRWLPGVAILLVACGPASRHPDPPPAAVLPDDSAPQARKLPPEAKAGPILTKPEEPGDPLDLSLMIVPGPVEGGGAVGEGVSMSAGRGGVPSGPPPAPAPPRAGGVDRSKLAAPANAGSWKCPFPPEADAEQIDAATVTLTVTVEADGRASQAAVLADPGNGFGRAARQCALAAKYTPALDEDGKPKRSTTPPLRIAFRR